MTGAVLADLIARCDDAPFVLIGHSLGGRVMVTAAQALATKTGEPRIAEMHLLGTALATNADWRSLHDAVAGTVWNYHSKRDAVLSKVFRTVELGRRAIGEVGVGSKFARIKDSDETKRVAGHSAYFSAISLRS
jgi:pimeloyl-ACP methyl ester carboxylesterase